MFDPERHAEAIARLNDAIETRYPTKTAESAAILDRVAAAARAENRAAAAGLAAIGELFGDRKSVV